MEKTVIAYYTGTGNTLELAKRIKGAELVDIIKINEGNATLDDDITRLGIFFPVYMGGVPYPVREFISNTLNGRDNSSLQYVFSLITCGSGGKNAEWMLDRSLQDIGIGLSYALSIRYPDSYLPLVSKVPDENKTKEILGKAEEKIEKALEDIEKEEIRLPSKPILGKIMSKMVSKTGPSAKDKKMSVGTDCTRKRAASSAFLSMSTLTIVPVSPMRSFTWSRIGDCILQGPHQVAKKSTSVGFADLMISKKSFMTVCVYVYIINVCEAELWLLPV